MVAAVSLATAWGVVMVAETGPQILSLRSGAQPAPRSQSAGSRASQARVDLAAAVVGKDATMEVMAGCCMVRGAVEVGAQAALVETLEGEGNMATTAPEVAQMEVEGGSTVRTSLEPARGHGHWVRTWARRCPDCRRLDAASRSMSRHQSG